MFIQESITSESPTSTASRERSSYHTPVEMVLLHAAEWGNQSRNQVFFFVMKGRSIPYKLPLKTAEDQEEEEEEAGQVPSLPPIGSHKLLSTGSSGSEEVRLGYCDCDRQMVSPIIFQVFFLRGPPIFKLYSMGSFPHGFLNNPWAVNNWLYWQKTIWLVPFECDGQNVHPVFSSGLFPRWTYEINPTYVVNILSCKSGRWSGSYLNHFWRYFVGFKSDLSSFLTFSPAQRSP